MLEKGYGILPNEILFSEEVSSTAKLVFCYISSLCAERGYCWALNSHIAEKFGITDSQVSRLISSLEPWLEITAGVNQHRKICLRKNADLPTQKAQGRLRKKRKHNITNEKYNHNTSGTDVAADTAVQDSIRKAYELYLKYFIVFGEDGGGLMDKSVDLRAALDAAAKKYRLTPKRSAAIERRVNDAGSKMLNAAIIGFGRDDFYLGKKEGHTWRADLVEYICRSYENVEKGARLYEQQRKQPDRDDPWAGLE